MYKFDSLSSLSSLDEQAGESNGNVIDEEMKTFCRTMRDLMSSKEEVGDIGASSSSSLTSGAFNSYDIEQQLQQMQAGLFKRHTFIQEKKSERKKAQGEAEILRLEKIKLEEEIKAKEAKTRAIPFEFDFGYLDAEVHDLLNALESVYPHVTPMPNTPTTKSIFTTTKVNVENLGLKVILNRLCITGMYSSVKPEFANQNLDEENIAQLNNKTPIRFIEELTRIRLRTDSVFAKELGEITGCLLSYPDYFVVIFEGPELSIMDMMHQAKPLFKECVSKGSILFIASHVMIRYLNGWTDLVMNPPDSTESYIKDGNIDNAKENLVILSDTCQRLWRIVANAKSAGLDPQNNMYDVLPHEDLIKYSIECHLLRPLHVWLRQVTQLTFGDFTTESWPQMYYPWTNSAHKSDPQFDSLGVLNAYDDMPGLDEDLENFIKVKPTWTLTDDNAENFEEVTKTLKEKLVKHPDLISILSGISRLA